MKIVHTLAELRQHLAANGHVAFVPTMGNLHQGHLELVRTARQLIAPRGGVTVASIFVNRLQFAPHEDFDTYPRTLSADCEQLQAVGCDLVFAPSEAELYPEPQGFKVSPPPALADVLEGHFRPGFFTGVCTVVLKLFECVFAHAHQSRLAVFGKKDYQQLMVIRQMVRQLALPVEVVGQDTQRAPDGLALSSRNGYLSPEQRAAATALHHSLKTLLQQGTQCLLQQGQTTTQLEEAAMHALNQQGWATDYLTLRRRCDLGHPVPGQDGPGQLVALGAARLGSTRLIDNIEG